MSLEDDYVVVDPKDAHVHVCACGQKADTRFMLGKDWYDRFDRELRAYEKANPPQNPMAANISAITVYMAEQLAKKAAGL